jgi:hypothetical protein
MFCFLFQSMEYNSKMKIVEALRMDNITNVNDYCSDLEENVNDYCSNLEENDYCSDFRRNAIFLTKLLIENGVNVHINNDHAIKWASENRLEKVVMILLKHGCFGYTIDYYTIIWASKNDDLQIICFLYWKYAIFKRKTIQKYTPIFIKMWQDVNNCELMYGKLPYELVELLQKYLMNTFVFNRKSRIIYY